MRVTHIKSKFSFVFFTLVLQLTRTLASSTDELILAGGERGETALEDNTASSYSKERGYECGNTFFTDPEVEEALQEGLNRFHYKLDSLRYFGPLYSDTESSKYFLFSIKKKDGISSFNKYLPCSGFVIFNNDKRKIMDVITRISNNHFTKCMRRGDPQTESSISVFENTNGYQCGHDFFSDQIIRESLKIAKSKIGGTTKYPAPYFGNLFPEDGGYLIWPILYRRSLHTSGRSDSALYNIVITQNGDFVDVVVKGLFYNFLRCTRTRKTTAPESDPLSKLFVPAPKAGFQCGKNFFSSDALEKAAETAKMVHSKKRRSLRYPSLYSGEAFNEPCWFWPILTNGELYRKAVAGRFRVVLTLDFKVMSAVIVSKDNKITMCDSKMLNGKRDHDTSDYFCNGRYISNKQLVTAAEVGCERNIHENSKKKRFYPARYEGPGFEKDGPYQTFPVILNGKTYDGKIKTPGRFRVVMNHSCEVVGAIYLIDVYPNGKKFLKCHKLKANGIVEESINDTNEPITEHKFTY